MVPQLFSAMGMATVAAAIFIFSFFFLIRKRKVLFTVTVNLRTGQTVVLRELEKFKTTSHGNDLSEIEWKYAPGAKQQIVHLSPGQIVSVVAERH